MWKRVGMLALVVVAGCDGDATQPITDERALPDVVESTFAEFRFYTRRWFESEEECRAANWAEGNCFDWLKVYPDASTELMLGDIVHRGSYAVDDTRIELSLRDPQFRETLAFRMEDGGERLVGPWGGPDWTLEASGVAACFQMEPWNTACEAR